MAIAQLALGGTAIYARISDDRQDGAGVERQRQDCVALVKRHGWGPAREFVDNSTSAYSGKLRPRYSELLAAVTAGEITRIVVWHIDRLYRQPRELEDIIDLADEGRVEVVTVNAGDLNLSNDNGITMARVAVAFANQESRDKSRRIKRQKQQAREDGKMSGGPRPFGWKATPKMDSAGQPIFKDGKPVMTWQPDVLDAGEVKVIRKAINAILAGASLAEIARQWSDSGVPQPQSGRSNWTAQLVRQVMDNPRLAGLVALGRQVIREGTWPAAVDRETWERCRALLDSRGTNVGMPRRRSLLTSLVVCGRCGTTMVRATNKDHAGGRRSAWRCPSLPGRKAPTGKRPCAGVSIAADQLEEFVTKALMAYVDNADLAALVVAHGAPDNEAADLTKELAQLDQRMDEAAEMYAGGKLPKRGFEHAAAIIESKRAELSARLARVSQPFLLSKFAGRAGHLRRAWGTLTLDQKRTILGESFGRIVVAPAVRGLPRFDPLRVQLIPSR